MDQSSSYDFTGSVDLYALFGISGYLEREGVVEEAIPLVARVLGCTVEEALVIQAKQKAPAEAWLQEHGKDYGPESVERAHRVFRLLVQHMCPDEAARAKTWFEGVVDERGRGGFGSWGE
ncbi:hypothetical protein [Segniliparus rugosus]|uniref:Uncharacterized protein n=1 Tax=Segniliparus rugosus (strain ATCC BAA-974 / DSM 45345 / CCUG 50838 / CIP 108380 / JCM 13579 / CDC 945) TaxID=679197 RepID=E5XP67_SEGRC|nr:hypothetical protein [Segniliparus rugosus]EFV13849.1 hypothetical protein HMPREF9336_01288 [Segniliparus rugosus ATCC BAA-974]